MQRETYAILQDMIHTWFCGLRIGVFHTDLCTLYIYSRKRDVTAIYKSYSVVNIGEPVELVRNELPAARDGTTLTTVVRFL